ncbi:MAG: endonuclease/exonuclease/phosphatase family protein [Bacteroidota bacterium]
MRHFLIGLLSFLLVFPACKGPKTATPIAKEVTPGSYRFAFYNVENLFDLEDDPQRKDDDFTPKGRNEWTSERYQKKLNNIAKVLDGMNQPSVVGLCEVENEQVLKDLAATEKLRASEYQSVHFDSPDFRGIDVALLYKKAEMRVLESDYIRINFPPKIVQDYTTRDILYVKGLFLGRDTLHFFVNHWPSRRGGLAASEPKRLYVAQQLRKAVDALTQKQAQAKIIIMGDLNDESNNKSLTRELDVTNDQAANKLYDCFTPFDQDNLGSYNYRGNWNMLDHIILSASLRQAEQKIAFQEAYIYKQSWMMYTDRKYGERPNRTYGGPRYYGGYSDHLPIYIDLTVKN